MNSNDILEQVRYKYSEYLEMIENPDTFVSGILAQQIVNLHDRIQYLEKRIKVEKTSRTPTHTGF